MTPLLTFANLSSFAKIFISVGSIIPWFDQPHDALCVIDSFNSLLHNTVKV